MRILYMDCFLGFDAQMLLGALIDAGASEEIIKEDMAKNGVLVSLNVKNTLRSSISCKKVAVLPDFETITKAFENPVVESVFKSRENSEGTDPVTVLAVICAAEQLGIEYVISSDISLPEDTDGIVLELLESAHIDVCPADTSTKSMEPADAAFLVKLSNESSPKPPMEILSIGYGAGGDNPDSADIITAIIGEFESENLFEAEETESLLAYL